jgi:hypothetical protein
MNDTKLRTIWQQRQLGQPAMPLAGPLAMLVKHQLEKRVRQLGQLGVIWEQLVPASLAEHTALESFNRGVLTVAVDSAAHRFELQTLLGGGLQREIQARFGGAIQRIKLQARQFGQLDESGSVRYDF